MSIKTRPTHEQANAFLSHEPIKGVRFEHNDFVRVLAGENAGEKGSLVSVVGLGDDPLFLLELETGFDTCVRQSEIELVES